MLVPLSYVLRSKFRAFSVFIENTCMSFRGMICLNEGQRSVRQTLRTSANIKGLRRGLKGDLRREASQGRLEGRLEKGLEGELEKGL